MPIRPERAHLYPPGWRELSRSIRQDRARGVCEFCRIARQGEPHPITGSRVVLTVAHLTHDERCADPADLAAMCQRCHNVYDQPHRLANAARTRMSRRAVGDLFAGHTDSQVSPPRSRVNPITGRPGPAPEASRNGDRAQARQRVNVEVRTGRRPHPNALPCADCGHVWSVGERRHEYDHHLGYAAGHHLDVEAVCTTCHAKRDSARAAQTHCTHGHEFTPENTGRKTNGTRFCRECRREFDRNRGRDAAYWREYRRARSEPQPIGEGA